MRTAEHRDGVRVLANESMKPNNKRMLSRKAVKADYVRVAMLVEEGLRLSEHGFAARWLPRVPLLKAREVTNANCVPVLSRDRSDLQRTKKREYSIVY
jgi:hypothetical protein